MLSRPLSRLIGRGVGELYSRTRLPVGHRPIMSAKAAKHETDSTDGPQLEDDLVCLIGEVEELDPVCCR